MGKKQEIEWTVQLSNGKMIERKDMYAPGQRTPWKKILDYARVHDLQIENIFVNYHGIQFSIWGGEGVKPDKFFIQTDERFTTDIGGGKNLHREYLVISYFLNGFRHKIYFDKYQKDVFTKIVDNNEESLVKRYYNGE